MDRAWKPKVGSLAEQLVERQSIDPASKDRLLTSATLTLGRCGSPRSSEDYNGTHLVVGEVQSGKTLAFTTLMALARDNGFRLIIVIAGTKTNLLDQTIERLNGDLLEGSGGLNPWRTWKNPDASAVEQIRDVISKPWEPTAKIDGSQTAVCFVLKHGGRLRKLKAALDAIGEPILRQAPALIIDDEADQASPNLRHEQGERSPIYGAITEMRAALPRSDLLMYTATPQAPLLVELGDELSPDTVTVLESGPKYVGGGELFGEKRDDYVRLIPTAELGVALEPQGPSAPPPNSLRAAIATFLLALVVAQERERPQPLSMLIHPAAARDLHHQYATWARSIRDEFIGRLADCHDVVFGEVLESDLRAPHEDLARVVGDIPPLEELAERIPPYAQQLEIREVNQGSEPIDSWGKFPGWILVGGNKLERGFTIENLAITYMPRGGGVGNADTIQQRGRFFGYKRDYLDLCRGWFTAEIAQDFADYIEHEDTLRDALRVVDNNCEPLASWRRELLLSPQLKPTRKRVVSLQTKRRTITDKDGWFGQTHLFDHPTIANNFPLAEKMLVAFRTEASVEPLDPRGEHLSAIVPLEKVYEVLADWGATGDDIDRLIGVTLLIGSVLEDDGAAESRLVFMDGVESLQTAKGRRRRMRVQREGPAMTVNIFQGRDPRNGYPGDRAICDPERVTLQLHALDLEERGHKSWAKAVPTVAVHLPQRPTTLIRQD